MVCGMTMQENLAVQDFFALSLSKVKVPCVALISVATALSVGVAMAVVLVTFTFAAILVPPMVTSVIGEVVGTDGTLNSVPSVTMISIKQKA